jgi:superfamily I DNA and/or RNA helicase
MPGTGKTHTITGIVSMLLTSGVKKLLICAPSNAAVDEIISRLSNTGLIG